MFTPNDLIPRLISNLGYSEQEAALTAGDLCAMQPPLREDFWNWWHQGKSSAIVVNGFSVARLENDFGFSRVNAYMTLDWIANEPDAAIRALETQWMPPVDRIQ